MPLPNFLLVGASKCGTTTLYDLLRRHEDVFLPDFKEPFFFSRYKPSHLSIRTLEEYERLFEPAAGARRIGEASAGYLYCEEAPGRIRATLGPEVKLLALLRHPVDRAYSMYQHRRRDAEEPLPFDEALAAEDDRIRAGWQIGWHYLAMGHYREQLERYYALFPGGNLLVLSFDDFTREREATLARVLDFLGLPPFPTPPEAPDLNAGFTIRHPHVERLMRRVGSRGIGRVIPKALRTAAKASVRRLNTKHAGYAPLDPARRRELTGLFREDIEYLARSVSPSFGSWLA